MALQGNRIYFFAGSIMVHAAVLGLLLHSQLELEAKASTSQVAFRLVDYTAVTPEVETQPEEIPLEQTKQPALLRAASSPKRMLPKQKPVPKNQQVTENRRQDDPKPSSEARASLNRPQVDSLAQNDNYLAAILSELERNKQYPRRALRRSQQGTVELRLVLDRLGNVLRHGITSSSGSALLDDEVLEMVERAQPFPPFPKEMDQRTLSLTIPIDFRIRGAG